MTHMPNYSSQITTITPLSSESFGAGFYIHYHNNISSAVWPSANLAIYVPFILRRKITVSSLFTLNGGTAAGNLDIGIYSIDGTRLTHTGATAQSGTSTIQTINITALTIGPGQYYMALSESSASATFYSASFGTTGSPSLQAMGVYQQAAAEPLPASATFASSTNHYIPMFGLSGITN